MVSTRLKNFSQNGKSSPNRGEHKTYLKPRPRYAWIFADKKWGEKKKRFKKLTHQLKMLESTSTYKSIVFWRENGTVAPVFTKFTVQSFN